MKLSNNRKLTEENIKEIVERNLKGETQTGLAEKFNVSRGTIGKHLIRECKKREIKEKREELQQEMESLDVQEEAAKNFIPSGDNSARTRTPASREASVRTLTAQIASIKKSVETKLPPLSIDESVVVSNKDDGAKKFRNKKLEEAARSKKITEEISKIICLNVEQPFRQNLLWAIKAAGLYNRTEKGPEECPNDTAFFLYKQACDNPKDFLGRFASVESKINDEDDSVLEKESKKTVAEIEEFL